MHGEAAALGSRADRCRYTAGSPKSGFPISVFQRLYQIVNLAGIESRGLEGEVGPPELKAAGLIRKATLPVKILGTGTLSRPLRVRAHAFSSSAKEKIDAAGGSAETLEEYGHPT